MPLLLHPLLLMKPPHTLLLGCLGLAMARQVTIIVVKVTIETVTVRNLVKRLLLRKPKVRCSTDKRVYVSKALVVGQRDDKTR